MPRQYVYDNFAFDGKYVVSYVLQTFTVLTLKK